MAPRPSAEIDTSREAPRLSASKAPHWPPQRRGTATKLALQRLSGTRGAPRAVFGACIRLALLVTLKLLRFCHDDLDIAVRAEFRLLQALRSAGADGLLFSLKATLLAGTAAHGSGGKIAKPPRVSSHGERITFPAPKPARA